MIRIHELKIRAGVDICDMASLVEKRLRLPAKSISSCRIVRESIDAREKPDIYRVFSLDIASGLEDEYLKDAARRLHFKTGKADDGIYEPRLPLCRFEKRPVVVGFGPCGIFAALLLARAGARPLIFERGSSMERRVREVESFWAGFAVDPESNVQFGEGGAGTFSDGKLTTGTKNPAQSFVLKSFVDAGADPRYHV